MILRSVYTGRSICINFFECGSGFKGARNVSSHLWLLFDTIALAPLGPAQTISRAHSRWHPLKNDASLRAMKTVSARS